MRRNSKSLEVITLRNINFISLVIVNIVLIGLLIIIFTDSRFYNQDTMNGPILVSLISIVLIMSLLAFILYLIKKCKVVVDGSFIARYEMGHKIFKIPFREINKIDFKEDFLSSRIIIYHSRGRNEILQDHVGRENFEIIRSAIKVHWDNDN